MVVSSLRKYSRVASGVASCRSLPDYQTCKPVVPQPVVTAAAPSGETEMDVSRCCFRPRAAPGTAASGAAGSAAGIPLSETHPQDLANTVWAFATLAVKDSVLLEAVRPAAVLHIWAVNPQDLANTTWALATLAVEDSELLEAVRLAAALHIWEFNPQELANTAWPVVTLALEDSELLLAVLASSCGLNFQICTTAAGRTSPSSENPTPVVSICLL